MDSRPNAPASRTPPAVRRLIGRLATLGVLPGDTDVVRIQKVALTLASVTVTLLALIWVGVYLALGLPVSAAIPFSYQVASLVGLAVFARGRNYRHFRFGNMVLMSILPFLLQWSLGGYVASSVVSLWALVPALGALFFYSAREAIPWFVAFVGLTVVSGLADPFMSASPAAIPVPIGVAFFVLNVTGVSLTAYLLLQYSVRERDAALARSDGLLLNVLPRSIAERLKHAPGVIADRHEDVTVLFADIADFTPFAEQTSPERVVGVLDEIFSAFDELTRRLGLEKIKTIGDAYMVVGGLPEPRPDHAEAVVELALEMQAAMTRLCEAAGLDLELRIGIASGPVVAGVIGRHRFLYDLWGDTVNMASRMESHGVVGRIQVTEATMRLLPDRYHFEDRGEIEVKGRGHLAAYLLIGRKPAGPGNLEGVTGETNHIAYHLVPEATWADTPANAPFRAMSLDTEGFIHLTHRMSDLVDVANALYVREPGPHVVLTIALRSLSAPWRYDGDERYPHVYGPLDRRAITEVWPIARDAHGAFLSIERPDGRCAPDMPSPG